MCVGFFGGEYCLDDTTVGSAFVGLGIEGEGVEHGKFEKVGC